MTDSPASNLIDARTLLSQIGDPDLRIFDCRFSLTDTGLGRRQYGEGHISGALYAHLDENLASPIQPDSGRHPLPDAASLAEWLGACGVSDRCRVVVYDDMNGAFAGRCWWLLRWLGHERVTLLQGGLQAWMAAGGELTTEIPSYPAATFGAHPNDALWIGTEELVDKLASGEVRIVDARAPERYRGEVEPTDPVAGHIPGAINLPFTDNLDGEGRFLRLARLRERFLPAIEGRPCTGIAHSCGSGVTACHNLLAMEEAGLSGSRLYVGSWSEWVRSPDRPVATGA